MKDPVIYIEADWAAKVARLEARCDELNEACSAKQVLIDHVAADERDFMELVEGYKRERDAEHLSRLSSDEQMRFQIKRAEGLQAEVAHQDAEIAALTERFVPLVEENERLHAELASARTVERKDLHDQVERLESVLTEISDMVECDLDCAPGMARRALSAQPAATGEGA